MNAGACRRSRARLRWAARRLLRDLAFGGRHEWRSVGHVDDEFIQRHTISFAVVVTVLVAGMLQ